MQKYGRKNASNLIDLLHKEGTLWSTTVIDQEIDFELSQSKKTDISLNFANLMKGDEVLQMAAASAYESLNFKEELANLLEF